MDNSQGLGAAMEASSQRERAEKLEGRLHKLEGQPHHILQFFAYAHLPPHLQAVSQPFAELANKLVLDLPRNPELTVALRKLLEAKDAAVRALVAKEVR